MYQKLIPLACNYPKNGSCDDKFQNLVHDMLNVMGVIDNIHIAIAKWSCAFVEDYFHHETIGYNIVAQVVVDNQFFIYWCICGIVWECEWLPCVEEVWVVLLCVTWGIFDMVASSQHRLSFYLLGDKGHSVIFWFMISQKEYGEHHLV